MSRAIVMLSGGIDSAVALSWARRNYDNLLALSFQYHLRPFREQLAVYRLLEGSPAKLIEVPVPFLRESTDLPQPLNGVPEGYVSNRNMIFYAIAGYYAEAHDCDAIVGGHIAVDPEAFRDASAAYVEKLSSIMNEALLTRKIQIVLPLAGWSKTRVLRQAVEWNVPLQATWSCYWDGAAPCGRCVSCQERAEAFQESGLRDPCLT